MKITISLLLTIVALNSFSQSVGDLKIANGIAANPITVQFSVYTDDTVAMNLYDGMGSRILTIVTKDKYIAGTYKFEYTVAQNFTNNTYYYQLKSSDKSITGNVVFIDFAGSSNATDFVKVTYTQQVLDTIITTIFDTTQVLIIDTLNCVKTTTDLSNYQTFPISENLVFHDNLSIPFSDVDKLVLFDLSGKYICRYAINTNSLSLANLPIGLYIGVFYQQGEIQKICRVMKE